MVMKMLVDVVTVVVLDVRNQEKVNGNKMAAVIANSVVRCGSELCMLYF